MKRLKQAITLCLGAALGAASLTGCYNKVTTDKYDSTVVATFGDEKIYLNEVNYYVKMLQVTYDSYFEYFYKPYYGFSNKKEFYEYTGMTEDGTTIWAAVKEDAMAAVQQTYILCSHAQEYGISLSDEDIKKVDKAVDEFMSKTDAGVVEACCVDEEQLTDIYKRNALANKVWEYLVSDIDTAVNEGDFRFTEVAYLALTIPTDTSSNDADKADDKDKETVDLEKKANEVLLALQKQMDEYEKSGKDDESIPYNAVIDQYKNDKSIKITYTKSQEYGKPEAPKEGEQAVESLQSVCWEKLKTGDYTTWYDSKNKKAYVVRCVDDDVEESKKSAIEKELDNRKAAKFEEKYPAIVDNSSVFTVKSRVYSQLKYEEIKYASNGGADASGNDVSGND